jgi:hypothetical protein
MATPVFTISIDGDKIVATAASGEMFEVVPSELPPTQQSDGLLQGISQVLRVSYANARDPEHATKLLKARIDDLKSGKWRPGTRSSATVKEPDDLALAVIEAVRAQGQHLDLETYHTSFLPNYLAKYTTMKETADGKMRVVGKAGALRELAKRKEIAPILAKLAAARAKEHAKDAPAEGPALADFASSSNTFRPSAAAE